MNLAVHHSEPTRTEPFRVFAGARVLTVLGGYFLVQAILRVLVSDTAELDESAQVLAAQSWQWGYGSDGPLYTWLQILSFKVFGTSILALAVVKNALLFSIGALTWRAAYELSRDQTLAAVAVFSLLLFPQITWESQRDLTHSVLATGLAAATFLVSVRLWGSPSVANYVLLGLCLGLGILSKYSYVVFTAALALSALTLPSLRPVLMNRRVWLALAICMLLTVLYFRWVSLSPELAFRRAQEVVEKSDGAWLATRLRGLFSLVECTFMLGAVLGIAYATALWRAPRGQGKCLTLPAEAWIWRTVMILGVACGLVVLATGIKFKDRWFQPLTFLLALGATLAIRDRLTLGSARRIVTWGAAAGLAALALLPGIPVAASLTGRPTRLNAPFAALSAELKRTIPEGAMIVASTRWVGGNLRLFLPEHAVVAPESIYVSLAPPSPWFVVWDATKSVPPPAALAALVLHSRGVALERLEPSFVDAPFRYAPQRQMKLAYVIVAAHPREP